MKARIKDSSLLWRISDEQVKIRFLSAVFFRESGEQDWRGSAVRNAGGIDIGVRLRSERQLAPADRLDGYFGPRSYAGTGAAGRTAESAVLGVVEASAGGLDVRLGPAGVGALVVIYQGIQAGQAGAGRQEDCQQEDRLEAGQVR
jgi:hypothetical protein